MQLEMVKETEHYHKWFNIMEQVKPLQTPVYQEPQAISDGNLNYSASLVSYLSNPPPSSSSNPLQSAMASMGQSGFLNAEHRDEKTESKTVNPYSCKVLLKGVDLVVKAAVDGNNNVVQFICTGLHLGGTLSVTKHVGKRRKCKTKVSMLIDQVALYNTLQPINYTRSQDVKKSSSFFSGFLFLSVLSVLSSGESRDPIRRGRFQVEAGCDD